MEFLPTPHHTLALKQIYTLSLLVLIACSMSAQNLVVTSEVQYDSQKKLYLLRSTNKPYTGRTYNVNYYSPKDTSLIQGFTNGKLDYTKNMSGGKVTYAQLYHNNGFRNDSICYEYYTMDQYSGDTAYWEYHWIDKQKVKRARTYTYYHGYNRPDKKKTMVNTVQNSRFYTRNETKDFTDQTYKNESYYDSAGYCSLKDLQGLCATYYTNGKPQYEGWYCNYDNRIKNKGAYSYYGGYCGTWKYYNQDGALTRTDEYDGVTGSAQSTYYHANGKISTRSNYKKKGSEIKLPPTYGITFNYNEEYIVVSTVWYDNGVISSETVRTLKGETVTYSYYSNGKPMSVIAHTAQNKPYGIHKTWNENGKTLTYINYSVEWVDTLCYKADAKGKITALNLRDRNVGMNWEQMPSTYYGNESKMYLYGKATVYKTFYANGKVQSESELKNGQLNGLSHNYDSLGNEILLVNFRNDIPDGAWTEWYPNGKIKKSYHYKNGLRDGNCSEYYSTGSLKWENIYSNGVAGKPTAYAENGSQLKADNYLDAFYPPNCLETQMRNVRGAALHYYFMDTTLSNSSVTIADSVVNDYVYKVIAMTNTITPDYDMCDPKSAYAPEDGFDIYHSCFVLSKSLYTEANLDKIRKFFGRHGLTLDKTAPSDNPVLGLEKEYLVYYSGKQMLNKQVVIDSVEYYIAPRAIDAKQGYVLSVDNNVPEGSLSGIGNKAKITSDTGYATITVESGIRYPAYPAYDTFNTTTYRVYDDLTCDKVGTVYSVKPLLYFAGK